MRLFFLGLVFGLALCGRAQTKREYHYTNTPLRLVMEDLEQKENVRFSFAPDLIQGKTITLKGEKVSFEQLLNILSSQTGLVIKRLTEEVITLSPRTLGSSSFCGYLLDAQTRRPIAYKSILNDSILKARTDEKGFFDFSAAEDTFLLKAFGYEAFTLSARDRCSPIYLFPIIEALDEVVVTGYITTGMDRRKDGSIEVTQKSLGLLPGLIVPDIQQSVQLVPGIGSLDESASGFQIRGGTSDQNLILFDGIKLFNSGYFYGMFSRFNPYATEKATIFKSGTSAAYGDRISGIIDISSGTKIPDSTQIGIGLDGLSLDAYIKAPVSKKLAAFFFARSSYTGRYQSPTYDAYARKIFRNGGVVQDANGNTLDVVTDDEFDSNSSTNDFSFHDLNAKLIWTPDPNNRLTFSGLYTRNDLDFAFTSMGEQRLDSLVTKNSGLSITWRHQGAENRSSTLSAYYTNYDSHYQNLEVLVPSNVLEEVNIRSNSILDTGLELRTDRTFLNNQSLALGYQLSYTDNSIAQIKEEPLTPESNVSAPSDESNFKNAFFGEYSYTTKNNGILGGGIRLVHYSSVGRVFLEPRLNLEYPILQKLRIKASLERRNQPISQLVEFDQTELRLENNLWRLSDDRVYPLLQSDQVSGGFLYDHKGMTLDVDAYFKRLYGLTSYTNGFSTPLLELSEGESSIAGVDVLIKKRVGNYRIWLGYSFNDITFDFPNIQDNPFPGNNDITHSFRLSNSLKIGRFESSLGWQYRSGEPFTPITSYDAITQEVTFGNINSARLQDYHRLDASARYTFPLGAGTQLQLGASALNLYDRIIPLSITYRVEENDTTQLLDQVVQRFSFGITPNFSLRLFF